MILEINHEMTDAQVPCDVRCAYLSIGDNIVVSIPACHAGDPGSIPGRRGIRFTTFKNVLARLS